MSNFEHAKEQLQNIDPAKLAEISGGNCTPDQIQQAIDNLKESYDTLVDFASYVIERVASN